MRKLLNIIRALITRSITIECDHIPHRFTHVSYRKIINWILTEASVYVKPSRPWGYPTHLFIEPTNHCNIKCVLCPVTEGLKRPQGHMSLDLFEELIDEVGDNVFLILLWDWGEPFLNPHVYDMIKYAKNRNIQLISSTNGHIFAKKDHAMRVVESGLDSLVFAMDGTTQETYEKYRQGGHLDQVIQGIRNVVDAKRKAGSTVPLLNIRFIIMNHNEHEIPQLRSFAESLGVDLLTTRTLYPYDGDIGRTEIDGDPFIPTNPKYQRFEVDPETRSRIRRKNNPCKTLWNNPAIHWNGMVCPCSFDPHDSHVLGDLNQQSFREIWFGWNYQTIRQDFRRNYRDMKMCSNCTYAFEGGSCSTEDIIDEHQFDQTIFSLDARDE